MRTPVLSLSRTRRSDRGFIIGRFYKGYVGILWVNALFDFVLLFPKWEK